jgi:hypothetical protein
VSISEKEYLENLIVELVLGDKSIAVKIRNLESIDEDFEQLILALSKLTIYYKESKNISKKLSYALFDVIGCFTQSTRFYSEDEVQVLEDKIDRLYEIIINLYES